MDVLNLIFSALNLLATVIVGVIQVTWMISRDVFRGSPRAKTLFQKQKRLTASVPQPSGQSF